jgi:hypothetical protein
VAPPQQSVVLRAPGPPPVTLSVVFARLGACLFRAPHATGLPAIEVVFLAADVPLRTLELPGLRGDRVTAEATVVPPRLVIALALGSSSATVAVSTASPRKVAAGRAAEFCSSVSRQPSPPVVLTRPRARRARPPPPDPSTLRRSGRIVALAKRGALPPSLAGRTS